MEVNPVAFTLLAALVLVPAVFVVTSENLFHGGLCLIASFLGVAGIYVTLGSPFVAGMQVLVYAGAISVVLLFAFMLTHRLMHPDRTTAVLQPIPALVAAGVTAAILVGAIGRSPWNPTAPRSFTLEQAMSVSGLGQQFLTTYLVPFELISVLLLVTLVGAVVIARKEEAPRQ